MTRSIAHTSRPARSRFLTVLTALPVLALTALGTGAAPAAADASETGMLYVVQGVTESTWSITVDGEQVEEEAAAKDIVGPLELEAGSHAIAATDQDGVEVTVSIDVVAGESVDAVLHRQVDPTKEPVITAFPNDLRSVGAGSGRLTVAHTAAVGPADIRVDQEVLFANVASGEELSVAVPGGTYSVDIVPASAGGPAVLGPVDLAVQADSLTRVFAIGVAEDDSMDAVVQVLKLPTTGKQQRAPSRVPGGTGGQAATSSADGGAGPWGWAGGLTLTLGAIVLLARARRRDVRP